MSGDGRPLATPSRPGQDICNTGPDGILWRAWLYPRALTLCDAGQLKVQSGRKDLEVWRVLVFDMVHGVGLDDPESRRQTRLARLNIVPWIPTG